MNPSLKIVSLLLRIGVAFSFLYAAIAAFITPDSWVGFLPLFMRELVDASILLTLFSILEIIIALGVLFMPNPRIFAGIAALLLLGLIVFNLALFDILFRDVTILLSALALVFMPYERKESKASIKN